MKHLQELVAAGNEAKLKAYPGGRDLLDLVRDFGPWTVSAQEFVSILRKMPARLYSIASSLCGKSGRSPFDDWCGSI